MRTLLPTLVLLGLPASGQLDLTYDYDVRVRSEVFDDDRFPEEAFANTARLRLGFEFEPLAYLTGRLELEHVQVLGHDDYDSGSNGRTAFPRIPDPGDTDVGELFLRYDGIQDTQIVVGRQKIVRGDGRYFSNEPWRQLEQSFDAFSVDFGAFAGWRVYYAYLAGVRRPFGGDSSLGSERTSSHLAEVQRSLGDWAELTGYAYYLDFEENLADFSTLTTGGRLEGGGSSGGDWETHFRFELARQSEAADNPNSVSALYYAFESGARNGRLAYRFGWQSLGGGTTPGDRFTTPLGEAHGFHGWADQFTETPDNGLEDLYIGGSVEFAGLRAEAIYHDFDAETGSASYGDEIDLSLELPTVSGARIGLAAAFYDADSFSADLERYWLWIEVGL